MRCGDTLSPRTIWNTLWRPWKHAAGPQEYAVGTLQTCCEYLLKPLPMPFKHFMGIFQTGCGYPPKHCKPNHETATGYQNRGKTAKIHSRGQKSNIFRPHFEGSAGTPGPGSADLLAGGAADRISLIVLSEVGFVIFGSFLEFTVRVKFVWVVVSCSFLL